MKCMGSHVKHVQDIQVVYSGQQIGSTPSSSESEVRAEPSQPEMKCRLHQRNQAVNTCFESE